MRKGKHVIGQSVLSYADGTRVDTVKDLILGADDAAIVALLVDEGGLLSSSRVVPIENVKKFGKDAVVIESAEAVVRASADPDVNAIVSRKETLLGKKVVTDEGRAMGTISDMYFDETTGRIHGFETSAGVLGDMARGTSFLAVDRIDRMGPDVIFVRNETAQELDNQVGGVQGALQNAGSKIGEAGSKIGEAASQAGSNLQSGLAQREPEKALLGRRSGRDVVDDNGRVIVANGERIRAEHIDWAKETGNVAALTGAVAAGQTSESLDRAGTTLASAGDSLNSMWDRFVARVGEMRDEQGRQADAAQTAQRLGLIQDAIGRPTMKVILDKSDNVILDFGEIVTHQAIQEAFDANMLDTLLASVHRATVSFPNEQLKVGKAGAATVATASGGAQIVDELEQKLRQTESERAEQQERARQEAEQARQRREQERQHRSTLREAADRERTQELEAARATTSSAGQPVGPGQTPKTKESTKPVASGSSTSTR